jgi:hypothetical protein
MWDITVELQMTAIRPEVIKSMLHSHGNNFTEDLRRGQQRLSRKQRKSAYRLHQGPANLNCLQRTLVKIIVLITGYPLQVAPTSLEFLR